MTKEQAARAMATGTRVIAHAGDDTDTGYILELVDETTRTMARVGWDSCQQSECDIDSLELDGDDLVTINPIVLRKLSHEADVAGDLATHNDCEMLLLPRSWHPEQIREANARINAVLDNARAQDDS